MGEFAQKVKGMSDEGDKLGKVYGMRFVGILKIVAVSISIIEFILLMWMNQEYEFFVQILSRLIYTLVVVGLTCFLSFVLIKVFENIVRIGMNTEKNNKLLERMLGMKND